MEFYPNGDEDAEHLSAIVIALRHRGVDILDRESDYHTDEVEDDTLPPADMEPLIDMERIGPDDTVGLYLKEMSRVPLLSVEQELNLAQRIEQGRQSKNELDRLNGKSSAVQRQPLETFITDGVLAREHLIKANTRLVVSIAKRYIGRGVPFLGLIQEGNLGLMKAVEKYDYHRGFRFSTYATWWIRQAVTRAIADQARTIRLPVYMSDLLRQLYQAARKIEQTNGKQATAEEIALELHMEPRRVQ